MVAGTGGARDRRTTSSVARRACAERRDGDGRHPHQRPALDAALRTAARLSAGRAFLQTLRRADRPGGICRLRRRHGAEHPCRGACSGKGLSRIRADLPCGALFLPARTLPPAAAGLAYARRAHRDPCRTRRRALSVQARHHTSAARPADLPDRRLPGGASMTTLLWTLIAVQIAMAAFDTIYHHELTERLAWRPSQRHELKLHAARSFVYVAVFIVLGFLEPHGAFAMLVIAALAIEVFITLADFIEEDMSRKLPASERVNHTLLAINYGAILVLALPVLIVWAGKPAAIKLVSNGYWSALMAFAAFGAVVFGLRDLLAARRPDAIVTPPEDLVSVLPSRQTVLVTGATGFIGRRLVQALAVAGHQVIVLARDPAKAATLNPPFRLITGLSQLPDDTHIDAIVNLACEPVANGPWTVGKRHRIQ